MRAERAALRHHTLDESQIAPLEIVCQKMFL